MSIMVPFTYNSHVMVNWYIQNDHCSFCVVFVMIQSKLGLV